MLIQYCFKFCIKKQINIKSRSYGGNPLGGTVLQEVRVGIRNDCPPSFPVYLEDLIQVVTDISPPF